MSRKPFTGALAILLIVAIVAPSILFITPNKASASGIVGAIGCISGMISGAAGAVVAEVLSVPVIDSMNLIANTTSASATTGSCIEEAILIPLARVLARLALAKITASIIGWITGNNGNGTTMFVQSLQVNLQTVGDTQANAFFVQFGRNSNSPFASAITSSLRTNYQWNTSSAGFFAANRNTMSQYSPNPNAFMAGNWSQGGIPAWFALTTQAQNNPYTLYQASQSQLASVVTGAQAARKSELDWGRGFMSWCGVTDAATETQGAARGSYQACMENNGTGDQCQAEFGQSGGTMPTATGVNPGDSCTNADGTPGTIKTPGSTIHDYTQKAVVSAGIDQLISAQDLDAALGAIATAMMGQVLNGVGGLLGASTPQGGRPALTVQLQTTSVNNAPAAASVSSTAQSKLSQLTAYTNAWNSIITVANTASTTLDSLAIFCKTAADDAEVAIRNAGNSGESSSLRDGKTPTFVSASRAQASAARAAILASIAPVIAQAQAAIASVSATREFALRVDAQTNSASSITSNNSSAASALSADTQTLVTMPPSGADIVTAQQNAQALRMATSDPVGSLNVFRGTAVDRMNLLSANAVALKTSVCTPVPPENTNSSSSDG